MFLVPFPIKVRIFSIIFILGCLLPDSVDGSENILAGIVSRKIVVKIASLIRFQIPKLIYVSCLIFLNCFYHHKFKLGGIHKFLDSRFFILFDERKLLWLIHNLTILHTFIAWNNAFLNWNKELFTQLQTWVQNIVILFSLERCSFILNSFSSEQPLDNECPQRNVIHFITLKDCVITILAARAFFEFPRIRIH